MISIKFNYFKLLKKINTLKKLSRLKRKKAQIFWLCSAITAVNRHNGVPRIPLHGFFNQKLFFKEILKQCVVLDSKNSFSDDIKFQLTHNNRLSINNKLIRKYKKKNFNLNDI